MWIGIRNSREWVFFVLTNQVTTKAGDITGIMGKETKRGHVWISSTSKVVQTIVGRGIIGLYIIIYSPMKSDATFRHISRGNALLFTARSGIGLLLRKHNAANLINNGHLF